MYAVFTPGSEWVSGETASSGQFFVLRKNHRSNPPIKMATTETTPTATASRLRRALNPTTPPLFPELAVTVGSKGVAWAIPAPLPEVGVTAEKTENGSPVDAIPVGFAVIEISLSTNPNPMHTDRKSKPKPLRCQRGRTGRKVREPNRRRRCHRVRCRHILVRVLGGSSCRSQDHHTSLVCIRMKRPHCNPTSVDSTQKKKMQRCFSDIDRARKKGSTYIEGGDNGCALRLALY